MLTIIKNNVPDLWLNVFRAPTAHMNKYDRGHAVIFGAPELSGATRLAAGGCSRIGAGLVTVLASHLTDIYRATLPADIMIRNIDFDELKKVSVLLGGSGGLCKKHRDVLYANTVKVKRVFDASAIPTQADWDILDENAILTPHEGEFSKCFADYKDDKKSRAINAAQACGAIIVLKGPQTVIAHPDGRAVLQDQPNPYLAKAGTGDVLAGFITGLLAQGLPPFEAACAAIWIHSQAGEKLGPGLTACDLEFTLPEILRNIYYG